MINKFLKYLTIQKNYSKHTLTSYKTDLLQFKNYLNTNFEFDLNTDFAIIKTTFIRSFLAELNAENISTKSIARKLSSIKSFYKWLCKQQLCEKNPATILNAPKQQKRLPTFITEKKLNFLFDEIEFKNDFEGQRDKLILELFYFTGIRRSELLNLKIFDVDLKNQNLKVLGKGNKERIIPIHPIIVKNIKSYIALRNETFKVDNNYFFLSAKAKKMYPKMVYNIVKKYLSLISTNKKRSPHVLRHTFATHMLNNGAELNAVKELLGHSSLAATQIYTHNTIKKLKDSYKKAHPRN